jgi:hypothetical protein
MPLNDAAMRSAKPGPKTTRLFDERGLYLTVAFSQHAFKGGK